MEFDGTGVHVFGPDAQRQRDFAFRQGRDGAQSQQEAQEQGYKLFHGVSSF